ASGGVRSRREGRNLGEARVRIGVDPPEGRQPGAGSDARHGCGARRYHAGPRPARGCQQGRGGGYESREGGCFTDDARQLRVVKGRMKPLVFGVLIVAALASAQAKRMFTGTVTDNMCPAGDHSRMRMGSTDAECTIACVSAHGAKYVLYDGKETYEL